MDRVLRQRYCYTKHVVLSGFISKIGKGFLLFVEEGATVDDDYYLQMLRKHLYVIQRLPGGQKFTIQQDRARFYTANSVTSHLNENVPDYIRKENWPPNSRYLNPLDYAIWGIMEKTACRNIKQYEDTEELSAAIPDA